MDVNRKNKIYFLSDAHLGAQDPSTEAKKEQKLLQFFKLIQEDADILFLVGDIFDFWFEYFRTIPNRYFKVLKALSTLVESGTRVYFIGGNHDLWGGDYLQREVGLIIPEDPLIIELYNKKFYLSHGDGILKSNWHYYYFTRPMLKSKITRFVFKMLHPDLGILLGQLVSNRRRLYNHKRYPDVEKAYQDFALNLLKSGLDYVILAHIHQPALLTEGNKAYLNSGNWYRHFSYGVYENGQLELKYFKGPHRNAEG
ncbi:UDP-2,3-diacylglucosamine diphosphatase [bacterium]|nr:UDP-2,3-diacylglucosamine diphosphatase [bacterium]